MISVVLLDQFCDGWDTAKAYFFDSYGDYSVYAPNTTVNVVNVEYCFGFQSRVGDWLKIAVYGFKPDFAWEVSIFIPNFF